MLKTGKKVSWKQLEENPHGFEYTQQAYGLLQKEMGDRTLQIAPQQFCKELLRLLDEGSKKETGFPLLLIGERSLHMMNSWLMELPNMQKRQQYNCCEIHPDDAQQLGIQSGDKISVRSVVGQIQIEALLSDKVRPGVVCIQHGWGSRVFAPGQAGEQPWCFGVNRNLLVDNQQIDPFSGIPNLNSTRVCVEKLH
jgi:formate dehydrogenase